MLPSNLFIILLLIGAIPLSLAQLNHLLLYVGLLYNLVLFLSVFIDFFLTPPPAFLSITRICDSKLSLAAENPVVLKIKNKSPYCSIITIRDEPPFQFEASEKLLHFQIAGFEEKRASYSVTPKERGDFSFGNINIRYLSRVRLFIRQFTIYSNFPVKVYPNLLDLKKYQIMLRKGYFLQTGLKTSKIYGKGTEFERLRDYQYDDGFRSINWKASARMGRLISTEYEVERTKNIYLLLDAGRLMNSPIAGVSRLDHAMNAALMLAYVATIRDDRVGILVFSNGIKTFIPPRRDSRHLYRIVESMYNIKSELVEPDYEKAFCFFRAQKIKRSLVVVFTELMEGESSKSLARQLVALHPFHLILCVTMKDLNLFELAESIPMTLQDVYEKAIARQVLMRRELVLARLRQKGCIILDTIPQKLSVSLVNKYMELKGKSLL